MLSSTKKSPLRITVVTSIHPDFDPRIWKHAKSLAITGMRVRLICPWDVPNKAILDGVCILSFKRVLPRILRPFLLPARLLRQLVPVLRDTDIVHFHDIDLLFLMALVRLFRPVVYDVHENYAEEMLTREWIPRLLRHPLYIFVRLLHLIFPLVYRNIVLVVPQQQSEFSNWRLRLIIIRNYASRELVDQISDDYFSRNDRVLYTGGHYVENGSWMLLDIAEILNKSTVCVPMAATDRFSSLNYRRRFECEIKNRSLHALSIIPRVPSYRIMDILNTGTMAILPSLPVKKIMMSIPTRLFEYMAAGIPIISSRVGIQGKIIEESGCGILVEPGDANGFAAAISRLVSDRQFAQSLGNMGQAAFLKQFTWESQMPSLIKFYESIMDARSRCGLLKAISGISKARNTNKL